MKPINRIVAVLVLSLNICLVYSQNTIQKEEDTIHTLLNNWHQAASDANFNGYFNAMAKDSYFLGTDATENWNKQAFIAYAKPYFDKGKAWSFTVLERNLFLDQEKGIAWFDELLETRMKICRGSGVVQRIDGEWKIKHYVLSATIPNETMPEVIKLKQEQEDILIGKIKSKN